MVQISTLFALSAVLTVTSALPMEKRIAQTIADSTADWVKACEAAGGAAQCSSISQTAFTTLLAAGKNCDQQDAADQMVTLAKTLGNNPEMIRLAQLFVQQPRNAPDSLQVPYCQTAPKNAELNGLFHCEFAGSNFAKFSGDQTGNLPLGVAAVNPPGSCPAKKDGPVPDGVQLNTLVTDPGVGAAAGAAGAAGAANASSVNVSATDSASAAAAAALTGAASDFGAGVSSTTVDSAAATGSAGDFGAGVSSTTVDSASVAAATGSAGDFGAGVSSTTVNSAAASVSPAALAADVSSVAQPVASSASVPAAPAIAGAKPFTAQNGKDAVALNAQFASLTAASTCTDGQQACVGGGFAQCVGGKFEVTSCGATQCFALPLVNKAGTSIACTSPQDAAARIAATGN